MAKPRKKTFVRKRQWLRPQRSPGSESTMHHYCKVRFYKGGKSEHWRTGAEVETPPHFSVDCDLTFRDCSNSISFDLGCYELKHFAKNRKVLRKIKAAVTELEIALNEAEDMARAHVEGD